MSQIRVKHALCIQKKHDEPSKYYLLVFHSSAPLSVLMQLALLFKDQKLIVVKLNYCYMMQRRGYCIQTKNKAYLSIEEIERTYIHMFGGAELLYMHIPTYSRKWLKQNILEELAKV